MSRNSWFAAAASGLGLILAAACAQTETASRASPAAATAPAQTSNFTDDQLRTYLAARDEIEPISNRYAEMTPEQRTQATSQILAIQNRLSINPITYNAILAQANSDQAFATRLATLEAAQLNDAKVRAFAEASLAIDPISRDLATATPEERQQASARIGDILEQHGLSGALYNAIATRAQADPQFAQRIAAAQQGAAGSSGESEGEQR